VVHTGEGGSGTAVSLCRRISWRVHERPIQHDMSSAADLNLNAGQLRERVSSICIEKNLPTSDDVDFEDPAVHAHNALADAIRQKERVLSVAPEQILPRKRLAGHFGKVYAMHWAGDSRRMVSASQDGKLIVWDALAQNKISAVPLRSSWVMTCAFDQTTPTSHTVACGGLDNMCSIYVLDDTWTPERGVSAELSGHDGYLSCCRFITSKQILTSSGDTTCKLWDIPGRKPISTFKGHTADVMSIAINPRNGNAFASGSCDAQVHIWDKRKPGGAVQQLWGHDADINCVQYFADGNTVASGSDDTTVRVWDLRSGREFAKFGNESVVAGITSVAVSRSGRLLFAGQDDNNCNVYDMMNPEKGPVRLGAKSSGTTHENRVTSVGVSPDGNALCTASWDTLLKVWA
jgi:guanine nucleotide-binding protein G(I)/G(S)/G(T) subunit beta-1